MFHDGVLIEQLCSTITEVDAQRRSVDSTGRPWFAVSVGSSCGISTCGQLHTVVERRRKELLGMGRPNDDVHLKATACARAGSGAFASIGAELPGSELSLFSASLCHTVLASPLHTSACSVWRGF